MNKAISVKPTKGIGNKVSYISIEELETIIQSHAKENPPLEPNSLPYPDCLIRIYIHQLVNLGIDHYLNSNTVNSLDNGGTSDEYLQTK